MIETLSIEFLLYTQGLGTMASHLQHLLGEITDEIVYSFVVDLAAVCSMMGIVRRACNKARGIILRCVAGVHLLPGLLGRMRPFAGRGQKKKRRARSKGRRNRR